MSGGGNLELISQGIRKLFKNFVSGQAARLGFTLAEVLITLGIIGVVAAFTLPSLINKYRIKQLRTAFMRSSSIIQNAMNQTATEFGYNNFKELNNICGSLPESQTGTCVNSNMDDFEIINEDFLSRFNKLTEMKSGNLNSLKIYVLNYSGKSSQLYGNIYGVAPYNTPYAKLYYLSDGAVISSLTFFYHGKYDGVSLTFDTNGPKRAPNRQGYDIFVFTTGTWNKLCTKKQDGSTYNGRGCYDYALKDINPDDNTKGYWDSLY